MSPKERMTFRRGTPTDIPGIMNLINSRWPPFKPASHYQWLFFDTSTPATVVCAEHDGCIVGLYVVHERQLQSGLRCGTVGGLVVEDDYRGMGLFGELGNKARELSPHLDVLCSIANPSGSKALAKHFGFKDFGAVQTMVCTVPQEAPVHDVSLEQVDARTALAGEPALPAGTMGFSTPASFQEWRYGQGSRYSFYKSNARDDSYIIIKLFPKDDEKEMVGDIMGVYARKWAPRSIAELIRSTIAASARLGVRSFYAWTGPEDPYAPLLSQAGFTATEPERRLCVLPFVDGKLHASWHVTMSDSMR